MNEQLKSCPFCGKDPELDQYDDGLDGLSFIKCETCNISIAIFLWD